MNERASSDTGEAGFNEMRVQFPGSGAIGEGSHDLTDIHYLYSMPRGYQSRHRDTHEIMLSVRYLGLGSRVWLQYNIILNSILEIVCVWIVVTWVIVWRVVLEEVVKCTWSWARVRYRTNCWRG